MNRIYKILHRTTLLIFCVTILIACRIEPGLKPKNSLEIAIQHLEKNLQTHTDSLSFPRSTKPDGTLNSVPSSDWTSGFYAGNLWQIYEYTKDEKWLRAAQRYTTGLENEKLNTSTHDLGFILYCSFGQGYRLKPNQAYQEIMLEGARSLSTRFDKNTGCIRSWDFGKWQYPVIIDNMMNLEFLFWATKVSGDSTFYKIAVTHANTTLKNHFRSDNSSYHVIDYDTLTGAVVSKDTHQGHSPESAWARGQAWALYGFTVAYRETKDKKYLTQAQKVADFYLNHPNLPADKIPYWDFNAPNIPTEERDASAAAIVASALLELSQYVEAGQKYSDASKQMLTSLSSDTYLAKPGTNNNFILMHSVGHKYAQSEIDVPIIYADYYFIEALIRYEQMKSKK